MDCKWLDEIESLAEYMKDVSFHSKKFILDASQFRNNPNLGMPTSPETTSKNWDNGQERVVFSHSSSYLSIKMQWTCYFLA